MLQDYSDKKKYMFYYAVINRQNYKEENCLFHITLTINDHFEANEKIFTLKKQCFFLDDTQFIKFFILIYNIIIK